MPLRNAHREAIANRLQEDKQWRDYAFGALEIVERNPSIAVNFNDGSRQELPFWDIYCQTSPRAEISLEEKIMTGIAWQHVLHGKYIYIVYQVRDKPKSDADIQGNNDILQDMVRRYRPVFADAEFWGGTQGADGRITFKEIAIKNCWGIEGRREDQLDLAKLSGPKKGICQQFPLEVGYCRPDQIDTHLMDSRCVARFPYGYDLVIFLEDLTDTPSISNMLPRNLKDMMEHYSRVEPTGQLTLIQT